ncbi:hypothetical protein PUN28_000294 [Cardiocondyla obscurior]|uniref:Secreted protein n=1 Tax=Cardiocondyla obscurior TaxID=286306 RepID=A0AAW2GYV4_9HYME
MHSVIQCFIIYFVFFGYKKFAFIFFSFSISLTINKKKIDLPNISLKEGTISKYQNYCSYSTENKTKKYINISALFLERY